MSSARRGDGFGGSIPSVVGSLLGVLLVTQLPPEIFDWLVPWLILFAAILFALQPRIARWITVHAAHERPPARRLAAILLFQTLVAIYGGYFGAGIGILMLSALALMGLSDIHVMNGVKNVLATSINAVAAAVFVITDKVDWRLCLPMMAAAIAGGFLGSRLARARAARSSAASSWRSASRWRRFISTDSFAADDATHFFDRIYRIFLERRKQIPTRRFDASIVSPIPLILLILSKKNPGTSLPTAGVPLLRSNFFVPTSPPR